MAEAFPQETLATELPTTQTCTPGTGCQQYELHLKKENNDVEYEKTGHVISVIKNDNPDNKRVFFNHHEIPENNHAWHDKAGISFHHGTGDSFVGGDFNFNHDNQSALGSFQQGLVRKPAMLLFAPPKFNVVLSKNAGATAVHEGTGLKLNWDVNSAAWKNTHWSQPQFEYSYQVKAGPIIAGQTTAVFHLSFLDIETKVEWKANNQPNVMGEYISYTISPAGRVSFDKNTAKPPNDPNRTSTEFPHIFPDQMVFDMNEFGTMFNGAMAIATTGKPTTVYAIKGSPKNNSILGPYMLYANGRPHSAFAVSNSKLLVNDAPVANSGVTHNTLWWNDLSEEHSDASGLPKNGAIDFSKDGSKGIIFRKSKDEPLMTVKPRTTQYLASSNLNIYALLAMDPNVKSSNGTTDVVQEDAMQDFYKIVQYYMDDNLRKDFISLNAPDMTGITNIANDDPGKNSDFYGFLSTPYLTQALANSTQKGSNELNGVRASKMLNKGFFFNTQYKQAFQDQTQQLYTLHFEKYFPLFAEYLSDQRTNYRNYTKLIQTDSEEWIKETKDTVADTDEEKEAVKETLKIIVKLANKAKAERLYWAYAMFRYISSPFYISWLQANMLNPNGSSQALSLSVKKFVTILQMLDPSGEFSVEFLKYIKQFQFLNILPQLLNLENLTTDFNIIMKEILDLFVAKYVDSKDPNMKDAATALQEQIRLNNLEDFMQAFKATLKASPGADWSVLVDNFKSTIAQKLGKGSLKVAELFATGIAVMSVVFVITGTIKWKDMRSIDKASFVVLSFTLFQKLTLKIVTGVLKARAAFVASEGSWSEALQTFFLGKFKFPSQPAEYLENGFAKWLVDTKGSGSEAGNVAMRAAESSEELLDAERSITKMEFAFGKNLNEFLATRIAAVFAVINIVLSAIQLSKSDTGLEKAMNALFLASGILEFISAVGGWTLSLVAIESASTLATVFGLAAALSVAAAVAGCIILIIIIATHKDPPTPLQKFVSNQASNAGYRMERGIDIDYFQITKVEGQSDNIGLSISETSDASNCIRIHQDKSLDLGALSHSSDTVWEIKTDEFGYAKFATLVYSPDGTSSGVYLKLKGGKIIAEGASSDDDGEEKWICDIQDDAKYTTDSKKISGNTVIQKFLKSGTFTIRNVASNKKNVKDYLNVQDGILVVKKDSPKNWILTMQGMKPSHLSIADITMDQFDYSVTAYPILLEPGSKYDKKWMLTPALPDFLKFNTDTGQITQTKDTAKFTNSYTLSVSNHYGSAETTFKLVATVD